MVLLSCLLESSPNLSRFEVPFLSDNDLRLLALHCGSSLRTVISRSSVITAAAVSDLCASCPNLRIFYHGSNYSKASEDEIIHAVVLGCPLIEAVCSVNTGITDAAINILSTITTLKMFKAFLQHLSNTSIYRVLRANTNLTELYLDGDYVNNYLVNSIAIYCRNLTKLELASQPSLPFTDTTYLTLFRGCPQLIVFKIQQPHSISDTSLRAMFQHCQHLQELRFNMRKREEEVAGANYIPILGTYYPSLTSLEVLNDGLPDRSFRDIFTHCTNLTRLILHNCRLITDNTVIILAQNCTSLKGLDLSRSDKDATISTLKLSVASILEVVSHCTKLTVLKLEQMPVNDEVLTRLFLSCPDLKRLFITRCDGVITEAGVATINTEKCLVVIENCGLQQSPDEIARNSRLSALSYFI